MYTIEPTDHWRAGDRAYCLRGLKKDGRHIVEVGRIYIVTEVRQLRGMMHDGLRLRGIETGDVWGFWSNRFVCLRGKPLHEIARRTRRSWSEAYHACADERVSAQGTSAGTAETEGLRAKPAGPAP